MIIKKKGEYGTLYLYQIKYRDLNPACPVFTWRRFAYDADHAMERWFDGPADDGWQLVSGPKRVKEGIMRVNTAEEGKL